MSAMSTIVMAGNSHPFTHENRSNFVSCISRVTHKHAQACSKSGDSQNTTRSIITHVPQLFSVSAAVPGQTKPVGSVCSTLVMSRVASTVATSGRGQTARSGTAIRAGTGSIVNPTEETSVLACTPPFSLLDIAVVLP